jgi:hypothetical protein
MGNLAPPCDYLDDPIAFCPGIHCKPFLILLPGTANSHEVFGQGYSQEG